MKTIICLASLLVSLSSFANFDFKLKCQDELNHQVLDLEVSSNGIGAFKFYQETSDLSLTSQYSDYGSIVLSFESSDAQKNSYQAYLDYMGGINWRGTLRKNQDSSIELQCVEAMN